MNTDERPHVVYRAYDADGHLLYIGCTVNLRRRIHQHLWASPWWRRAVVRVTVEEHPTRAAALDAETRAIVTEHPAHNSVGNGEPGPGRVPPSPEFMARAASAVAAMRSVP